VRVLAIYDWQENFDLSKHPETVVAWCESAKLSPNKVGFRLSGQQKMRSRTVFKKSRLVDVISEFDDYVDLELDDIRGTHYLRPNSHLSFVPEYKRYVVARKESEFSIADEISHLRLVCQSITPRYGFSNIGEGAIPIFATSGIASTSMRHDEWTRTTDLGRMLSYSKQHQSGKLHDVYELNILSSAHLKATLRGGALCSWIDSGARGQLDKINEDVFAWVVPDSVRSDVRSMLFGEGLLVASI
jgi:hypothetical protein